MDEKTRQALEARFPEDAVKKRRGSFGRDINYLETRTVISRLNDCFDSDWSFRILSHEVLETGEVLVHARLEVLGVCKEAFGRATPAISKETGEVLSLGDTAKSACSDALKKAATLLGLGGASLYADDPLDASDDAPSRIPRQNQQARPANGSRLTQKQLSAIWSMGRNLGMSADAIRLRCQETFGTSPEVLSRTDASAFITEMGAELDEARRSRGAA